MNFFQLVGRYFWLVCIVITLVNYRKALGQAPAVGVGPDGRGPDAGLRALYLRRAALFGVLPWIVMGAGILAGGVRDVWAYFRPQDADPWVLAWFATLLALALANAAWVFLADGARKVRQYDLFAMGRRPGGKPMPELLIKALAALGPFWILVWMFVVSTMNVPLPH